MVVFNSCVSLPEGNCDIMEISWGMIRNDWRFKPNPKVWGIWYLSRKQWWRYWLEDGVQIENTCYSYSSPASQKVFAILFNTSHDVQFQSPSWLIIICFLRYTGDRFRPLKQSPWTNRCFVSIFFFLGGGGAPWTGKKNNTIWMIPIWYDLGHHSIPPTSKMTYNIF